MKLPFPAYDGDLSEKENEIEVRRALDQVEGALRLMSDEIVAIIVEPIQGAGGQRVALPSFFRGLSELAHRYDVYLAFDEVQTGLGATGRMWGLDHFDLPHPPQSVASGKKFGNGVVYMLEPLGDVGVLDSTWGGSLADMVRVVREIEIVEEEGLVEQAALNGEKLAEGLRALVEKHPHASNVRGPRPLSRLLVGHSRQEGCDGPGRKGRVRSPPARGGRAIDPDATEPERHRSGGRRFLEAHGRRSGEGRKASLNDPPIFSRRKTEKTSVPLELNRVDKGQPIHERS